MIEILAWLTVVGIPIVGGCLAAYGIYKIYEYFSNREPTQNTNYVYTAPPSGHVEPTTTTTTTNDIPQWTSIDEESFMTEEPVVDCRKIVDAGTRIWRIYRSVDRIHWAECDPALTERAACNYADYIKRSNPEEYVRCDDPNGVILFYE